MLRTLSALTADRTFSEGEDFSAIKISARGSLCRYLSTEVISQRLFMVFWLPALCCSLNALSNLWKRLIVR